MEGTRQRPIAAGVPDEAKPEAAVKSGPSPAVRLALVILGVVALLVAIVYAVRFVAYASTHETTDDAIIDTDEVQITSKIAERVESIRTDTNLRVRRGQVLVQLDDTDERNRYEQALAAVNAQRATTRAARENVALTRDTQSAQDAQSQGAIAQARAGIDSAAAQSRSAERQIAVSAAAVDTARAQLKAAGDVLPGAFQNLRRADADLRRTTSLVSTGDVAAQQLDAAKAVYEQAKSTYQQARANVGAADASLAQAEQRVDAQRYAAAGQQSQVGVQQATLQSAQGRFAETSTPGRVATQQATADAQEAQVTALLAQLKTASDNLSYTQIRSPIDGYVGQKSVEIGRTVAPGETLLTIVPEHSVYITANFKETQIGQMHVGDEVDINVDAYKGVKFVGRVRDLSPASQNKFSLIPAQNATGNFVKVTQRLPVRVVFDHPDSKYALRPGLSVEASVKVK